MQRRQGAVKEHGKILKDRTKLKHISVHEPANLFGEHGRRVSPPALGRG